jgi:hypothetical protein
MYTEKRAFVRTRSDHDVYYSRCSYEDPDLIPKWSERIHTVSVDESEEGVCILTARHLPIGTRIKVSAPDWEGKKEGTVRWCKSYGPGRFRTGLAIRLHRLAQTAA